MHRAYPLPSSIPYHERLTGGSARAHHAYGIVAAWITFRTLSAARTRRASFHPYSPRLFYHVGGASDGDIDAAG